MRSAISELSEEEISEEDKESEKRQLTFFKAIRYLLSVEAMGNVFVDYTILLLIGSVIDFHLEPDTNHRYARHAKTLEDIESPFISMSIKLDFLNSNGMPFFLKWIDRGLRNKIAHLDFEIDQEGNFLAGKQKKKVDIELKSSIFWSYFTCVAKIYSGALRTAREAKEKKR